MFRFLLAFALLAAGPVAAQSPSQQGVTATLGSDTFLAGGTVRRTQAATGDLIAAGGTVEVAAPVQGDLVAAGGTVRLSGPFAQDVYAAGGRVQVDGTISRNARIAGGQVEIGSRAQVEGNLTVAGGDVMIRGAVQGYVQAAGGQVLVDAPVAGDVVVNAGTVELGPNARIGGKLRYRSAEELRRDPAAEVAGVIERLPALRAGRGERSHTTTAVRSGGGWLWTAGLMALAALIAGALPLAADRIAAELRMQPWLALLLGFIALVTIPVSAVILLITVLGIPIAIIVLLLYFVLLIVGYVMAAVTLGEWALARFKPEAQERTGWRILAAALAMLAVALLGRVPFVGALVIFAALLLGIGAIVLASRRPKVAPAM